MNGPQNARPKKRELSGWLILDKPVGMTSTHAVSRVKRAYQGKKAGHAGTLDPLATGCLPIAFGEATKTVPYAQDGRKIYRFTVKFGEETNTDDSEGTVTSTSAERPDRAAIEAVLPRFRGAILQVPPQFSAIKVDGERAYDLARDGEAVALEAREIEVHRLDLVDYDGQSATFETETGKGAYVRSLARDIGRALGCLGHVTALRRTMVGPFTEEDFVTLDEIEDILAGQGEGGETLDDLLLPVEAALDELPEVMVNHADAGRLMRGQSVLLRGRDAPLIAEAVKVTSGGHLIAIADVDRGTLNPRRVFNLPEAQWRPGLRP